MNKLGIINDKYFDKSTLDIRDSKEFKQFQNKVLLFIKKRKSVTWRELNQNFENKHYWLSMAVEMLGNEIYIETYKIPEKITYIKK